MNKYISTSILVILLLGIYTYTDISLDTFISTDSLTGATIGTQNSDSKITNTIASEGLSDFQVLFCPRDDCEDVFIQFINDAQSTLHCALYDVGLESIQNALKEKSKTIEVQVVTDDHYYDKFVESFVTHDASGHMHNKFCIKDNRSVITGSMNPTNNGVNKNNNNLLIINSEQLATNFELEFQELWQGIFKKGEANALELTLQDNNQNTIVIENYFCPDDECAKIVESEIDQAQSSIYFMTFSFTHEGIANSILIKNEEGIEVSGVFEKRLNSKYSKFHVMEHQELDVKLDGNDNSMHHKVFIIDNRTVITGSMNPSNNGVNRNDETLLIIHSEDIAQKYINEFNFVWAAAE
mgnify:CR=1 FL=1